MSILNIATFASATVMGAQVYEESIARLAQTALADVEGNWEVRRTIIRSLRSQLPGNRKVPMGWVWRASPAARRRLGSVIYPRGTLTHRMKVGVPPSPHGDVVTLHDITPWIYRDELAPPNAAVAELRRADAVVTVSEFSAGEIESRFGVRAHVIPNGIDPRLLIATPLSTGTLDSLHLRIPYILVAGGASERKNLRSLAEAWQAIAPSHPQLTLALSGTPHPARTALFSPLPRTALLGHVPDQLLQGLFAGATAVIVPSLYEGFGLPALEGMAAGVPVVAANASSLPEVVGDGGILVDPTPSGLAAGIEFAASHDTELTAIAQRGRQRAATFTWERSARMHAEMWSRLAG